MMLDAEIEPLESPIETEATIAAISDISIQNRYSVKLGIGATVPSITAIAARMLGMEAASAAVSDEQTERAASGAALSQATGA